MIEQQILISILKDKQIHLIPDVNPDLFTDQINSQIINLIIEIWGSSQEINEENVFRLIRTKKLSNNPLNQRITSILKDNESVILPSDWEDRLKKTYQHTKLRELYIVLGNSDLDHSTKLDTFEEKHKEVFTIKESREYVLSNEIEQYKKDLKNGVKDQLNEKSIGITSKFISKLIGDTVRPFPYCISAKPGGYKTQMLHVVAAELLKFPFPDRPKIGKFFSLEDNKDVVRNKFIGQVLRINKESLMDMTVDPNRIEIDPLQTNLIIHDKKMSINEFIQNVRKQMAIQPVDFMMLDFIQKLKPNPGQGMMEAMIQATDFILDITKDYMIPFIFTSQLNMDGNAKWSSTINEDTRFHASLEDDKDDMGGSKRIWRVKKDTWGPLRKNKIQWEPETGHLLKVYQDGPEGWMEI